MTFPIRCYAALVAILMWIPAAGLFAQEQTEVAVPQPEQAQEVPQWVQNIKNPLPGWTWGADLRLRNEYFNNAITLDKNAADHEWHFQRYRLRWWNTLAFSQDVALNARLIWEGRHYTQPKSFEEWYDGSLMVDSLNLRLNAPLDLPLTATIGRQDIILGDGWLVLEGTPLDDSRTIFFDAIRLTWDLQAWGITLDMIYIDQAGADDRWLNCAGEDDEELIEQDERGAILWLTYKGFEKTEINSYFIYKHTNALPSTPNQVNGILAPWPGTDADIYTFGGRLVRQLNDQWSVSLEAALQFGNKDTDSLLAGGLIGRLIYSLQDSLKSQLHLTYEFLSGDDPDTAKNEQFDPLWGRWAQWSDLYVYTYGSETRIAETTNLHRINLGYSCQPWKNGTFSADYHLLLADENSLAGTAGYTDDGTIRGHLFTLLLQQKFNAFLSGHLRGEVFLPGDYYDDSRNDTAVFLRAELTVTF